MKKILVKALACLFILLNNLYTPQTVTVHNVQFPNSVEPSSIKNNVNAIVSHNSGKMNLKVPIIENEKYSLDLSYSSDPFYPTENSESSFAGFNWQINTGGKITREVNGIPDDWDRLYVSSGYLALIRNPKLNSISNENLYNGNYPINPDTYDNPLVCDLSQFDLLGGQKSYRKSYEIRPDKFYFNFMNISGYFYIDAKGNPIISSEQDNLKIDMNNVSLQNPRNGRPAFSEIKITDGQGNQYYFGGNNNLDITYNVSDMRNPLSNDCVITAWHLNRVAFSNGEDIRIKYFQEELPRGITMNEVSRIKFSKRNENFSSTAYNAGRVCNSSYIGSISEKQSMNYTSPIVLLSFTKYTVPIEISTTKEVIKLQYDKNLLSKISIFNIHNQNVKNFVLGYKALNINYINSKPFKLLQKIDLDNGTSYDFEYNIPNNYPSTLGTDRWGFWSGTANNEDTSIFDRSDSFLLKKITYPAKGWSEFFYEPSRYSKKINSKELDVATEDGMIRYPRIKKIIDHDSQNSYTYEYTYIKNYLQADAKSSGLLTLFFQDNEDYTVNFRRQNGPAILDCNIRYRNYNYLRRKSSVLGLSAVNFSEVQEYKNGFLSKIYYYSEFDKTQLKPLEYRQQLTNLPEQAYSFVNEEFVRNKSKIHSDFSNLWGRLIKESYFDNNKKLIKEISNEYSYPDNYIKNNPSYIIDVRKYYYLTYSKIFIFPSRLFKRSITSYFPGSTINRRITYDYSLSNSTNIKKSVTYDGNNHITETDYQYAREKGNQYLIDKNMVGIPLQTTVTKKSGVSDPGKIVSSTETKYPISQADADQRISRLPVPYEVLSKDLQSATMEREVTYDMYHNKGYLLQFTSKAGTPTAIIYGYDQTLPIAKVEGATYVQASSLILDIVARSDADTDAASEALLLSALDAFRNNPVLSSCQITTYTHDPFIGVTSITPPSGIREIYKYDTANRLEKVVDVNGNILKEYKYNYKQ